MQINPPILVADNTLIGRKALELLLRKAGYRLAFANNDNEAIYSARVIESDVVLLDMMPNHYVQQNCCHMRANSALMNMSVLLIAPSQIEAID